MDVGAQVKQFLPASGWKQWVGLFVVVVLIVAVAAKFGVQRKADKLVGG